MITRRRWVFWWVGVVLALAVGLGWMSSGLRAEDVAPLLEVEWAKWTDDGSVPWDGYWTNLKWNGVEMVAVEVRYAYMPPQSFTETVPFEKTYMASSYVSSVNSIELTWGGNNFRSSWSRLNICAPGPVWSIKQGGRVIRLTNTSTESLLVEELTERDDIFTVEPGRFKDFSLLEGKEIRLWAANGWCGGAEWNGNILFLPLVVVIR